ncbi:hypothetical protein BV898_07263 [Hypsibius exemplaris]|uniref:Uncharacterized protein n=1 Tax=Hypsibius exemplaris TaxID=2072580 RepID=A0A1W0WTV5_HYPEX|nr:hypothetical protein BV898_07263 [Hypsibius exemplaris]
MRLRFRCRGGSGPLSRGRATAQASFHSKGPKISLGGMTCAVCTVITGMVDQLASSTGKNSQMPRSNDLAAFSIPFQRIAAMPSICSTAAHLLGAAVRKRRFRDQHCNWISGRNAETREVPRRRALRKHRPPRADRMGDSGRPIPTSPAAGFTPHRHTDLYRNLSVLMENSFNWPHTSFYRVKRNAQDKASHCLFSYIGEPDVCGYNLRIRRWIDTNTPEQARARDSSTRWPCFNSKLARPEATPLHSSGSRGVVNINYMNCKGSSRSNQHQFPMSRLVYIPIPYDDGDVIGKECPCALESHKS